MLLNNFYARLVFLAGLLFLPLESWSTESSAMPKSAVELRINNEVRVNSARIVLGDVATIYAKNLQDFEKLSGLVLSQFPENSKSLSLPRVYVEARIREALNGKMFDLNAPDEITFLAERMGISSGQFAEEILKKGKEAGKIPETVEVEIYPGFGLDQLTMIKNDSFHIEPAAEMPRWLGDLTFKVTTDSSDKIFWVKAKVKWFAEVWVAKTDIPFGQSVLPTHFISKRMELGAEDLLKVAEFPNLETVLRAARSRRSIHEGMALAKNMLERRPDAIPGSSMKVVFTSENGIRVTADGSLIGSGIIGEDVRAKLKSSRKIISGRLISDNVVEVAL